jgi:hypothetical protein
MHRKDDDPDRREFGLYDPSCIKAIGDWHGIKPAIKHVHYAA